MVNVGAICSAIILGNLLFTVIFGLQKVLPLHMGINFTKNLRNYGKIGHAVLCNKTITLRNLGK